jgi:hypothetical protein
MVQRALRLASRLAEDQRRTIMSKEKEFMAQASFCLAIAGPIMLIIFLNCSGDGFFHYYYKPIRVVGSLLMMTNFGFLYWLEAMALALGLYSRENILARAAIIIAVLHILLSFVFLLAVRFAMN